MMTPERARELTKEATQPDMEVVKAVLSQWDTAIEAAARAGKNSVRESMLPALRVRVPKVVYETARYNLTGRGFKVESVQDGPNESTFEVSW